MSTIWAPWAASSSGSRSRPLTSTDRSQVRWFRPTWSSETWPGSTPSMAAKERWKPIATLHSPTARWPASSRARVTMPTGFVKSMIQAPGAARRRARSAMSSTTGTVRSAFANPPAPVVSCPTQPYSSGQVSSRCLAACPPIRSWSSTAPAPSRPSSRSVVQRSCAGCPAARMIRAENGPTTSSRAESGSISTSSLIPARPASLATPSTSSGV